MATSQFQRSNVLPTTLSMPDFEQQQSQQQPEPQAQQNGIILFEQPNRTIQSPAQQFGLNLNYDQPQPPQPQQQQPPQHNQNLFPFEEPYLDIFEFKLPMCYLENNVNLGDPQMHSIDSQQDCHFLPQSHSYSKIAKNLNQIDLDTNGYERGTNFDRFRSLDSSSQSNFAIQPPQQSQSIISQSTTTTTTTNIDKSGSSGSSGSSSAAGSSSVSSTSRSVQEFSKFGSISESEPQTCTIDFMLQKLRQKSDTLRRACVERQSTSFRRDARSRYARFANLARRSCDRALRRIEEFEKTFSGHGEDYRMIAARAAQIDQLIAIVERAADLKNNNNNQNNNNNNNNSTNKIGGNEPSIINDTTNRDLINNNNTNNSSIEHKNNLENSDNRPNQSHNLANRLMADYFDAETIRTCLRTLTESESAILKIYENEDKSEKAKKSNGDSEEEDGNSIRFWMQKLTKMMLEDFDDHQNDDDAEEDDDEGNAQVSTTTNNSTIRSPKYQTPALASSSHTKQLAINNNNNNQLIRSRLNGSLPLPRPPSTSSPPDHAHNQQSTYALVAAAAAELPLSIGAHNSAMQNRQLLSKSLQPRLRRDRMSYVLKFGEQGAADGQFAEPSGIAVALPHEDIFIADANNHRIQVFDKWGKFRFHFGAGKLKFPNRIAISHITGEIVVSERPPVHQIQVFDRRGSFQCRFGARLLRHPRGLTIDHRNRVVVVECKVMRVFAFDLRGELLQSFDCSHTIQFPNAVAVSTRDEIYISDNRDHCVKIFTFAGELLRQIGGQGVTNYPIGVILNERTNRLYVIDNYNNLNVTIFRADNGQLLHAYESSVKHQQCLDVALLADGQLVVSSKDLQVYVYRLQQQDSATPISDSNSNSNFSIISSTNGCNASMTRDRQTTASIASPDRVLARNNNNNNNNQQNQHNFQQQFYQSNSYNSTTMPPQHLQHSPHLHSASSPHQITSTSSPYFASSPPF